MLFNTLEYCIFFLVVLTVSWLAVGWRNFRAWFILLASFYFYFSNNSWQILILLFTTTVDYSICLFMGRTQDEKARKILVSVSLVSNLGVLAYFKYMNFFGESFALLAAKLGWSLNWLDLNVALPVGISFYTFEALSYTIDVYRRKILPERDWSRLAFLVSFFPHLIAGPIIRAADFFPQMDRTPALAPAEFDQGLFLIARGVLKKFLLADMVGRFVDPVFAVHGHVSMVSAWVAVYGFTLQIYFDFSAYTDIAIGSAKLLSYQLPENFRRPYAALCVTDFWRRWHISLSSWLRDYLYISLGGNRMARPWGVYRNLLITMLLGGLWHGAAWNFVVWGGIHGLLLSGERFFGIYSRLQSYAERSGWRRLVHSFLMFHLLVLLWIPFRAPDLATVSGLLGSMISISTLQMPKRGPLLVLVVAFATWLWQYSNEYFRWTPQISSVPLWLRGIAYALVVLVALVMGSAATEAFIYFRF